MQGSSYHQILEDNPPTMDTKISKLQIKAKAKLDAVMQGRGPNTSVNNRIGTSRHPSTGGTDVTNMVSHTPRRPSTGGMIKRINSQPAY
ncbi:hypothetical protein SBRCBS47491_009322 [Sporothrix bragantina]|uniref:Uncharacterized protein n=1 Tax=Sporothrix bragantina TaxID=671064 RepID=A0ABP0CX43_9PEZI